MRKKWKKFLAMLLFLALCMNLAAAPNAAAANVSEEGRETKSTEGELSVTGNGTLGRLLTEPLEQEIQKQEENNGCNIFSIQVEGKTAVVDFETTANAELLVAVYDESGVEMLASGSVDVFAGEETAEVDIDIASMPQYFYLRGFLVESDSFRPICTAYESPNYTKEMQDFLASTTADYEQDRVLNFDDDANTNFAVYTDETILLDTENGNQITSVDEENGIYQIENADEAVLGLQKDDIFSCTLEDGSILAVKVESVEAEGTAVTVIGQKDVDISEVFSYVKIEESLDLEDAKIDPSTCDEGVVYNGLVEEVQEAQPAAYGIMPYGGVTVPKTMDFNLVNLQLTYGDASATLNGNLSLRFDNTFEYYLTPFHTSISLKIDYSGAVTIDFTGHASGSATVCAIQFSALGIVNISFTPKILFEANAKLNAEGSLEGTVGFFCSLQEGMKNLTTAPKFKATMTAEADLYLGLELKPSINLFLEQFADASMTATVGGQVTGKMFMSTEDPTGFRHSCAACVDGDIYGKYSLSFRVRFLDQDWLTYTHEVTNETVKVLDFYYSVDKGEFGFTTCPYLEYLVTVTVKDSNGNPISDAIVNSDYTTDENGVASLYLAGGSHSVTAFKNGYGTTKSITVKDSAQNVTLRLNVQANGSGTPDGENSGEIQKISLGDSHSLAVMKDGSLYTWGANGKGQLGDRSTANRLEPVRIDNGANSAYLENSVIKAAAGGNHSAAVTEDGSLYAWGEDGYRINGGILYSDTVTTPKKIMDHVIDLSMGYQHSAAITQDGSLYWWGYMGRSYSGGNCLMEQPTKIMDNVAQVSLGEYHSAAITKDGSLYVWGRNDYGQIGDGTDKTRDNPVKIMDNVAEVSLGGSHSAAITQDGSLYVWGYNASGQIGDGTTENRNRPVLVARNIAHVSLGASHTAAVTKDGGLYMWGNNTYGQIGNGTEEAMSVPVKVMDNVVQAALGSSHSAAVTRDGSIYLWGLNESGQLGEGDTENRNLPMQIAVYDSIPTLYALSRDADDSQRAYRSIAAYSAKENGEKTVTYTDLKPNEYYNFYSMKYKGSGSPLASDNLLYVAQAKTDENGSFTLSYTPDEEYATPTDFVVAMSQTDINEAEFSTADLSYTGAEQYIHPILLYHEQRLTEGTDYVISGSYQAKEVGEYSFTITGIGAFTGTRTVTYSMKRKDCKTLNVDAIAPMVFNGSAMTPEVAVYNGETVLEEGRDYTVSYQNHTGAGIGIAIISGMGNYEGSQICLFDITPCELTEDMLSQIPEQGYTGQAVMPEIPLSELEEGKDYTVSYVDNVEIGTAAVVITGCGNYTGSLNTSFTIGKGTQSLQAELTESSIAVEEKGQIVVTNAAGEISYRAEDEQIARVDENGIVTGVGKGTTKIIVTAAGDEHYKEAAAELEIEVTEKIVSPVEKTDVRMLDIHEIPSAVYSGAAQEPEVRVSDGEAMLAKGTDYAVEYQNNINAGTGIVKISGLGNYEGSQIALFTIQPCVLTEDLLCRISEQNYTGQELKPDVLLSGLIPGKDYRVEYSDNIEPGTASVTVTGNGNYTGTLHTSFMIVKKDIPDDSSGNENFDQESEKTPQTEKKPGIEEQPQTEEKPSDNGINTPPGKVKISSVKPSGKKKLKVKWKKTAGVSGYEIQCCIKKTFKTGVKKVGIRKGSKTSVTLAKLKTGKRYYIRIRTYKKVQIAGKSQKLYGAWSKAVRSKKIK